LFSTNGIEEGNFPSGNILIQKSNTTKSTMALSYIDNVIADMKLQQTYIYFAIRNPENYAKTIEIYEVNAPNIVKTNVGGSGFFDNLSFKFPVYFLYFSQNILVF